MDNLPSQKRLVFNSKFFKISFLVLLLVILILLVEGAYYWFVYRPSGSSGGSSEKTEGEPIPVELAGKELNGRILGMNDDGSFNLEVESGLGEKQVFSMKFEVISLESSEKSRVNLPPTSIKSLLGQNLKLQIFSSGEYNGIRIIY